METAVLIAIVVLIVLLVAFAWAQGWLNRFLPESWRPKAAEAFLGVYSREPAPCLYPDPRDRPATRRGVGIFNACTYA